MFYHLLYPLSNDLGLLNIFRYITLRSFLAFFFSIAIVIAIGGFFIKFMRAKQFGQIIRDDGPKKHLEKVGTPTFGGVLILFSILFTILFCGNFSSLPLNLCLVILFSFAGIGFCDDYLKVLKKNTKGLSGKLKLFWQTSITLAVVYYGRKEGIIDTKVFLPFLKDTWFDLG